ncbi:MAG: LytTR family DNA-binding domain-containing protein [Pseudomonadota bacterium]
MLVFIVINQVNDPLINATINQELLYWCTRVGCLIAGLWAADSLVARWRPDRLNEPAWLRPVVIVSAVGLLPYALAEILVEPHLPIRPEFVDDDLWAVSPLLAYVGEYVTILTIVLPVHFLLWLLIDKRDVTDNREGIDATPPDSVLPPFLEQSAVGTVDDVLALQAEEHYVRVIASQGAQLIHYRFGDAINEMPAGLGLQVHRSWWVAGHAVRSAKRGARRWQLVLDDDLEIPVSDSYVAAVREHGWLKRKPELSGNKPTIDHR